MSATEHSLLFTHHKHYFFCFWYSFLLEAQWAIGPSALLTELSALLKESVGLHCILESCLWELLRICSAVFRLEQRRRYQMITARKAFPWYGVNATCLFSNSRFNKRLIAPLSGVSSSKSYPRNRPWRPIGLWDVKDPTLSRQSAHS
jgi:hypothetical protein